MLQKIREAIQLLFSNFRLVSLITLTVWLPGSILLVYLRLYVFPESLDGDELRILTQEIRISSAIEAIFGPLYCGALLYALAHWKQGQTVSYGEAISHGASKSFKLFWTRLITGLFIGIGFILIIPGVILALRYALVDPIVVLDDRQGGEARSRSTELTKGKRWAILGAVILAFVITVIALTLVSLPFELLAVSGGGIGFFILSTANECIVQILSNLSLFVLFLFYWDAQEKADRQAKVKGRA